MQHCPVALLARPFFDHGAAPLGFSALNVCPQWPRIGFKGSAPGQAVVQCGLCSVLQRLTSRYIWMLTFFSLQSTNGMLFFAFADSFLIRTCLGILFWLSSHALKLHKHIFHLSNVLYTLSFILGLKWFRFPLSYSAITLSNSSVPLCFLPLMRSEGCGSACPRFSCCAGCVFELLSGCGLWWTGSAWLALLHVDCLWLCLCWRCRGASITFSVFTSAVASRTIL